MLMCHTNVSYTNVSHTCHTNHCHTVVTQAVSAATGDGIPALFDALAAAADEYEREYVPTA